MSKLDSGYKRVIPRDLFNEGNLLKCLGAMYIELGKLILSNVDLQHDGKAFDIVLKTADGSLLVRNVLLVIVRGDGTREEHLPWRPINSREPYPLWLTLKDESEIQVFTDEGKFTEEMIDFLKAA